MTDKEFIEYDGISNMICTEESMPKKDDTESYEDMMEKRERSGDEGYMDKEKRKLRVDKLSGDGMA